jgi:hypothetical protein
MTRAHGPAKIRNTIEFDAQEDPEIGQRGVPYRRPYKILAPYTENDSFYCTMASTKSESIYAPL